MRILKGNKMKRTKKERLTKVLSFELKPIGKTRQTITDKKLLKTDQEIHERLDTVKPLIDLFYKHYIREALFLMGQPGSDYYIDFTKLEADYRFTSDKELSAEKHRVVVKNYQKDITEIQKIFHAAFLSVCPVKEKDLISAKLFEGIKKYVDTHLVGDPNYMEYQEIMENVTGCAVLLKKFMNTRLTALNTVGKRIMENFECYCNNIANIQLFMKSQVFSELEKNFPDLSSFQYADYYAKILTQEGIDYYNLMISGIFYPDGTRVKGFNMCVNEENIKNRNDHTYTGSFFRTLKKLDKQILYPAEKVFSIEHLDSDEEVRILFRELNGKVPTKKLLDIILLLKETTGDGIFVIGNDVHTLSHLCIKDHNTYPELLEKNYIVQRTNELETVSKQSERKKIEKNIINARSIVGSGNIQYSLEELSVICKSDVKSLYIHELELLYKRVLSKKELFDKSGLIKFGDFHSKVNKKIIKDYLESINDFRHVVQLIARGAESEQADILFYEDLNKQLECFTTAKKALNLVRNYVTRKPADTAKGATTETFFGSAQKTIAKWWNGVDKIDVGKNLILQKDNRYFFATLLPGNSISADSLLTGKSNYSVLTVKKGSNGMKNELPKRMFGQSNGKISVKKMFEADIDYCEWSGTKQDMKYPVKISRELYEANEKGLKTQDAVKKHLCTEEERRYWEVETIRLAQQILPLTVSYANVNWNFKAPEDYSSWLEFCAYCDTKAAYYSWLDVDENQINSLVEDGAMLLFQISHRDLYKNKKNPDSYVKTLEYLLSEENFKNPVIHLNGAPSFQYRKAVYERKITHKKGSILVNRWDKNGEQILNDIYMEIYNYYQGYVSKEELSKEALEELPFVRTKTAWMNFIKSAKYTKEKFLIRIIYTKNADVLNYGYNMINEETKEEIQEAGKAVLSISRSIYDLLYCVLFDKNGKVIEKRSLNIINGIDYYSLLKKIDKYRKSEKSNNWEYTTRIKDIRTHYIDLAIGEIVKYVTTYDAVIVLEKVNNSFKNKMQMIDNQLFKTFESRLELRLNDCYNKNISDGEAGSLTNPYQLTKQGNLSSVQNGYVFYLNGAYTNMCPVSGFVNFFNFGNINALKTKKELLLAMKKISYINNSFQFEFNYNSMERFLKDSWKNTTKEVKKTGYVLKTDWLITAVGPVTRYDREKKKNGYVADRTQKAYDLLKEHNCINDNGNVLVDTLNNTSLNAVYDLFAETVTNTTVRKCDVVPEEYYVSPVAGACPDISPSEIMAENLGRKFFYFMMHDTTEGYIGYMQEQH